MAIHQSMKRHESTQTTPMKAGHDSVDPRPCLAFSYRPALEQHFGDAPNNHKIGRHGGEEGKEGGDAQLFRCADLRRSGMSIPGMSIPGMSIPGMSIPGMSIPGMSIPGMSIPGMS